MVDVIRSIVKQSRGAIVMSLLACVIFVTSAVGIVSGPKKINEIKNQDIKTSTPTPELKRTTPSSISPTSMIGTTGQTNPTGHFSIKSLRNEEEDRGYDE